MRNYILTIFVSEHLEVEWDIMKVLFIDFLFKVVNHCHLGWIELDHKLSWHRGDQTPTERKLGEINKFTASMGAHHILFSFSV